MKTKIFTALAMVAIMAACTKSEADSGLSSGNGAISISAIITRAGELNFDSGDKIGLSVYNTSNSTTWCENSEMTYTNSIFTSDDNLMWYEAGSELATLAAYYPYNESGTPATFTVLADQRGEGYTNSDLMTSVKTDVTPTSESVLMVFKHKLSSVAVAITNNTEDAISSVVIKGAQSGVSLDLLNNEVALDSSSEAFDITANMVSTTEFYAIFAPQTAALTVEIVKESGATLSQNIKSANFESGLQYDLKLVVLADDIEVTLSGGIEDWGDGGELDLEGDTEDEVSFEEFDGYFIYDGVTYNTVTLSNGTTWMASNLAYLPKGYTPSTDADVWSDVWYPYAFDYDKLIEDDEVALSPSIDYIKALTDDESIKAKGYLYSIKAALSNGEEIGEDNCYDFEGAQGICPPGWHVPTRTEYMDLVGVSNVNALGENGTQYNTDAIFYDEVIKSAPISKVNEGGFNYIFTGYRYCIGTEYYSTEVSTAAEPTRFQRTMIQSSNSTETDWYGEHALSYYMTSTGYKPIYSTTDDSWTNTQFFGVMSTFVLSTYPTGRLSLAYVSAYAGQALRCVKDSASIE